MTDGSASKSRIASGGTRTASASWRDDMRRSFGARSASIRDFVRERRWPVVAAVAIVALSGAGVVANVGGAASERADALEKTIASGEKRVDALDLERKRREDQLADLQKKLNAKESQIAETEEKVAALEKRREGLQREVAELVAPVAPGSTERVSDGQDARSSSAEIGAASTGADDTPPDESMDAATPSTASVDASAVSGEAHDGRIRAASRDDDADAEPTHAALAQDRADFGPVRVFIHVRAADPIARERAAAVAAELRRRGVAVAQIRGVPRAVRRDSVRYYYDQDRGAISELQEAVRSASPRTGAPVVNDLRSYGAAPKRGTIELWLS